jgi:hypothetical protein
LYLCTDPFCTAYEAGARGKGAPDRGTIHVGFRCADAGTGGGWVGAEALTGG